MMTPRPPTLIIHHRDLDGYVAAWAADRGTPPYWHAELCSIQYGEEPPKVDGHDVAILDFSFDRETTLELAAKASSLVVLDHHKGVAEKLAGLESATVHIHVDESKAGCRLAWEHYRPGLPPPPLVLFAEDRDLYRFQLPGTMEFCAAVETEDDWRMSTFDVVAFEDFEDVIRRGRPIYEYQQTLAKRRAKHATFGRLRGHDCLVLNHGGFLVSETAEAMLQDEDSPGVALIWTWTGTDLLCSLRSSDDGPDVSEIAAELGGGGHTHAAGFRFDGSIDDLVEVVS